MKWSNLPPFRWIRRSRWWAKIRRIDVWNGLAFCLRSLRKSRWTFLWPIIIPFIWWGLIGTVYAGIGFGFELYDIEPWLPNISLDKMNWVMGVLLVLLPIIVLLICFGIPLEKIRVDYLRIKDELETGYKKLLERRKDLLDSISSTIRHVHFQGAGQMTSGLRDFFSDFVEHQSAGSKLSDSELSPGRFHAVTSDTLLGTIVERFLEKTPTTILGVIDGDITHKRLQKPGDGDFLLLYLLLLDCQKNPSDQITRIFSYRKPQLAGNSDDAAFLLDMLIINILCAATTYLHLRTCASCSLSESQSELHCERCRADEMCPMMGLDYVCMPRNRLRTSSLPTVYFDFSDSGKTDDSRKRRTGPPQGEAFILEDGVYVDAFKRDFELRLARSDSHQNISRVTFQTLFQIDAGGRVFDTFDSGQLGSSFVRLETLFQKAKDVDHGLKAIWEKIYPHTGLNDAPNDLHELGAVFSERLMKLRSFAPEIVARPS